MVGIAPHGKGLIFAMFILAPFQIHQSLRKQVFGRFVEAGHEVMSDKRFAIQDLCSTKGIYLNRPKQKENEQFEQFDIASTRIHVERFIGRVRDWTILNNIWPLSKMDTV